MSLKKLFIFPSRKKGSILIIAVWTLLFLSFFCVTLGYIVSVKVSVARSVRDRMIADYLAKAGIEAARQSLRGDDTDYDYYGDVWCNNEDFFKDVPLSLGTFKVSFQEGINEYYGLTDEEKKLNLNYVSGDILCALLVNAGISGPEAQRLAGCIIDWRDADDEPLPLGAEDSYYTFLEVPYDCKDADFESVEELLLVKGMTAEIFSKIKDNITVFGNGAVNVNTACGDVLTALGMGKNLANKIMNYRLKVGEAVSAENIRAFKSAAEISEKITLSEEETEIVNFLTANSLIGVVSNNFKVVCGSALYKSSATKHIACIINRDGQVKYWLQN